MQPHQWESFGSEYKNKIHNQIHEYDNVNELYLKMCFAGEEFWTSQEVSMS